MTLGQKANGLIRIGLTLTTLMSVLACSKHEDEKRPAAAINPPIYKTVTRENYISGKKFCQVYEKITSKEFGKFVTVPKDYNNPNAGSLEIYVYSMSAFDAAKPTYIYVDGGPGQNTHGMMPNFLDGQYNELRFDQRGLGCSSPENFDLYKDATLYSTENTIRDMDLIRQSYGISQWSVYGISYGTVASTMYASKFSNAVRSLVLEGVVGRTDQIHDVDYKASKLNQAISNLNSQQRQSLDKLLHEHSEHSSVFIDFIYGYFYRDIGMREVSNNILPKVFSPAGIINRDALERLKKYYDNRDNEYSYAQQPGMTDTNILSIIYCKNLNDGHAIDKSLAFNSTDGFYSYTSYNQNNREECDSIGVKQANEMPYEISQNPVSAPVFYFQGSHDGATLAVGAIAHWQTVPQKESYFMLAQKGGHNPNLTRLNSEKSDIMSYETQLFKMAIAGSMITDNNLISINNAQDQSQKWILFREKQKEDTIINQELEDISNRSFSSGLILPRSHN